MKIASVEILHLSIPLRLTFRHSRAERDHSSNLIVRVRLESGTSGYGEGVPVSYVTGETIETAAEAVRRFYWPALKGRSFTSPEEVARALLELQPVIQAGVCYASAKCAFELAVLDAFGNEFACSLDRFSRLVALAPPADRARRPLRFGVALTAHPDWVRRKVRLLKLYGLRDFKLKIGLDDRADQQTAALLARRLRRHLARGKASIRADANCAYGHLDEAFEALRPLVRHWVECVEQPMPPERDGEVEALARRLGIPVLLDESVRTVDEAGERLRSGRWVGLNIRLSKNGGFFEALRLANLCRRRGAPFQVGCHVGETSLLAAAQCHLARLLPDACYLEGAFGTHLLQDDISTRSVRFGYGGRPPKLGRTGLGVDVDEQRLRKFLRSETRLE